jgi:isoleucyl-tRNA synthetase
VQAFIEMLSNWYVRLSRRRFWKGENDTDKLSAYATLYECLTTVTKLIAPTMPFVSDVIYRNLVAEVDKSAPDSVHLALWPEHDPELIDRALIDEMRLVQRLVSLGRAAREQVKIGVRQPLASAYFAAPSTKEAEAIKRIADLIAAELNVKQVSLLDESGGAIKYKLNPLPSALGRKFGKDFPRFQKALREGAPDDVRRWAEELLRGQNVTVTLDGTTFEATPAEVQVLREAGAGYTIAEDGVYLVALDTTLTDDLVREGLAREVVRRVQQMRKDADFNISDHIALKYQASGKLAEAITQFADYISGDTLSDTLEAAEPNDGFRTEQFDIDGEALTVAIKRV